MAVKFVRGFEALYEKEEVGVYDVSELLTRFRWLVV